ncbi:hypothetical protein IEQ34_025509 [Dendrobium chrysotoxum]|uniref:Uncharacterized protein n=1 Tax=Dendrobium chrysotoxum TaxID=161865 RepID=A0AAV7FPZ0_DENCH|nr:hypothetical protein IEQ34_025509 [Dendrobium chrysotoxum]
MRLIVIQTEGAHRMRPPFRASVVAGTQAETADANEIDESDDSDDDEEVQRNKGDASLVFRSIPHIGGVNRIRARLFADVGDSPPEPPEAYHVATFADTGKVHIFDIAPHLQSLSSSVAVPPASLAKKPQYTVTSHGKNEGFALAWGPPIGQASSSRLLSGDVQGRIFLTTLTPSSFTPTPQPFTSHTSSVEDLQWSPEELTVFASCSADQSVRIWDVRVKQKKSVLSLDKAHDADVNVMSWNTLTKYLLLTGGDEGGLKVWDLRQMKGYVPFLFCKIELRSCSASQKPTPVASFSWHQAPITSVEWHPTDDSSFLASAADDSVTLGISPSKQMMMMPMPALVRVTRLPMFQLSSCLFIKVKTTLKRHTGILKFQVWQSRRLLQASASSRQFHRMVVLLVNGIRQIVYSGLTKPFVLPPTYATPLRRTFVKWYRH